MGQVSSTDVMVCIPARLESQRLPAKPMRLCAGKPLLWHTWRAACKAVPLEAVWIITDSAQIAEAAEGFGAQALLRTQAYDSGSRRIFAALNDLPPAQFVVNLQCDEPQIRANDFNRLLAHLWASDHHVATFRSPFRQPGDRSELGEVKVVVNRLGQALYFSRSDLRNAHRHVGVYAFERDTAKRLCGCARSRLAEGEQLEQLEWMDSGFTIGAVPLDYCPIAVNTPQDMEEFCKQLEGEPQK